MLLLSQRHGRLNRRVLFAKAVSLTQGVLQSSFLRQDRNSEVSHKLLAIAHWASIWDNWTCSNRKRIYRVHRLSSLSALIGVALAPVRALFVRRQIGLGHLDIEVWQ